jgi:hypothetical protein
MCDNCGRQNEQALLVTDTTDITPTLLNYKEAGALSSISAKDVVPFLKKHLKWRVVTVCYSASKEYDLCDLTLCIGSRFASRPKDYR